MPLRKEVPSGGVISMRVTPVAFVRLLEREDPRLHRIDNRNTCAFHDEPAVSDGTARLVPVVVMSREGAMGVPRPGREPAAALARPRH